MSDSIRRIADEMAAWANTKMGDRQSSRIDRKMVNGWAERLAEIDATKSSRFSIEVRPVACVNEPDAHTVRLKIGVQSFEIGSGWGYDTNDEAVWMASMLSHALLGLINDDGAERDKQRGGK